MVDELAIRKQLENEGLTAGQVVSVAGILVKILRDILDLFEKKEEETVSSKEDWAQIRIGPRGTLYCRGPLVVVIPDREDCLEVQCEKEPVHIVNEPALPTKP